MIELRSRFDQFLHLKTMPNTQENGQRSQIQDTDSVHRFGLTGLCIKDTGKMTRRMDGDDSFMLMEMFMKVNGKMIRLMVKVFTSILMALSTMVNGKKISKMDMELRHGQTAQNTTELMSMERNTEKEFFIGLMDQNTKVNSMTTTFMESVPTNGLMAENMKESG